MSSYMNRRTKHPTKHGTVSEKRTMKKLGARLTPGSGAMAGCKSDGYDKTFRYENKATIHKSFSVKLDVLHKIEKEALETGLTPVLCVSFTTGSGMSVSNGDYVVISRDVFESLRDGDIL